MSAGAARSARIAVVAISIALACACAAPASAADRARDRPVPILMYHAIEPAPADARVPALWVTPAAFRSQLRALQRAGYRGVTLRRVWNAWHHGGSLPRRPVVLSFDDGYASQVRDALPALQRAGWPAVLNLTLDNLPQLGGTRAVRRMVRAGWAIDSHTLTHPDLTTLADAALRRELRDSRARIRRLFGEPTSFFCYPSGRYDARVVRAARAAGYLAATTVRSGFATPTADPYALPRILVSGGTGATALLRRLRDLSS